MGRYSNWKTKLGLLAVLGAILVPVGIYTFGEAMPYLNLLSVTADPSNMQLTAMEIVDREFDDEDSPDRIWTSITWRLDLEFTNPLSDPVIVPRASLSINYLNGTLGTGWISEPTKIQGGTTQTVKAYLKTPSGDVFDAFMVAFLNGVPLNLKADFEAYILIDGMLGEPYIGVKFPTVLNFPLPTEIFGTDPFISNITRGEVNDSVNVDVVAYASDLGTGIIESTLKYKINNSEDWTRVDMDGPALTTTIDGVPTPKPLPIASADPNNPQEFTATIPAQPAGTLVEWKLYFEDWAGNVDHAEPGNYIESETYNYTVLSAPTTVDEFSVTSEQNDTKTFFLEFLEYIENNGINLLHHLYLQGKDLLKQLPYLQSLCNFFYDNNVDMEYWLTVFSHDFVQSVKIMADSGIAAGKLMDILGVDSKVLLDYVISNVILETEENLVELAKEIELDPWSPEYSELRARFNEAFVGTRNDLQANRIFAAWISYEFVNIYTLDIGILHIGGTVVPEDSRVGGAPHYDFMPYSFTGIFPVGWFSNFAYAPWENFIRCIASDTGENYHLVAANLLLANRGLNPLHASDDLISILGGSIVAPGNPFPVDDLYPYTHQLTTIAIFFPLAIVSYLVIKRELISHRNIKKDLAIKRTFKKKGTTSYK